MTRWASRCAEAIIVSDGSRSCSSTLAEAARSETLPSLVLLQATAGLRGRRRLDESEQRVREAVGQEQRG